MKKVKSYLKNIQNNEEYQKDIEFLEKKSNGREDKKLILDICFLSTIPLISIYITYFLSFSNPFAIFILIIIAVPVSYKIAKILLDHMYKDEGSVAKLKLYANLYKTIKVNIILTVKSFVSINYFSFFQYKYYLIFNFAIAPSYLYALNL